MIAPTQEKYLRSSARDVSLMVLRFHGNRARWYCLAHGYWHQGIDTSPLVYKLLHQTRFALSPRHCAFQQSYR